MSVYKLHYLNGRGRAEVIRLIFAAAGQKYEDYRIELSDWPKCKKNYVSGKVPLLEVGDVKLYQSVAIMHYLALQFGLAGKTPLDAARCHSMVESTRDLMLPLGEKLYKEREQEKMAKVLREEIAPELKKGLVVFDEYLQSKSGGYAIADQLTYADLSFQNTVVTVNQWLGPDFMKAYPNLQKNYELVSNLPNVSAYLNTRPKTLF